MDDMLLYEHFDENSNKMPNEDEGKYYNRESLFDHLLIDSLKEELNKTNF